MASRALDVKRALRPKEIRLGGIVVITAAGAISSQTGVKDAGATVTKDTGNGRYLVTFDRTYKRVKGVGCSMIGPDTAAFPTTTGSDPQCRTVSPPGTAISLMRVQFKRTDTQADADPASGTAFSWFAEVALI